MDELLNPLRKRRLEIGLSMTELAEKVGVTHSAVSQWENGKTRPNGPARKALALALYVTEETVAGWFMERAA